MTEFERYACYDRNIGTATLSRYGAVLSNHINPTVIEERKLNATSIDVFSRLLMDRVIWLGCPIDDDVPTSSRPSSCSSPPTTRKLTSPCTSTHQAEASVRVFFADTDRNYWMNTAEAKEYGMIDRILSK